MWRDLDFFGQHWKVFFFPQKHFVNQDFFISMGFSKNGDTPKSSILIGFSIIFTIHFGVPLFLEFHPYDSLPVFW